MLEQLLRLDNFVEIAILGAFFFGLMTLFRGTRGAAMLKAAVFIFVIAFLGVMGLANLLGLDQIKLLLQYMLAGSFIALMIIFAPEMRRGLLRIAQARFLAPLLHGPAPKVIDELVNAAVKLSKNRIGALVAIERDVGLGEYVESGQKIDAALSSELLESIFYPGNPLHDGAVVIQHDRVAAAACLFPLSEDPTLSRTMGTRHRAAIGISEETDSIVIVVSEETGRISVCVGGKMTSDLSREALEKLLRELYTKGGRPTLGLRWGRPEGGEGLEPEPEPNGGPGPKGTSPGPAPAAEEEPKQTETRKRKKPDAPKADGDAPQAAAETRRPTRRPEEMKEEKKAS